MQPLGTVPETPLQPAGAFVELANQHEQLVGLGIDTGRKINDGSIEIVDGWQVWEGNTDSLLALVDDAALHDEVDVF
jgi:hypothetical protein